MADLTLTIVFLFVVAWFFLRNDRRPVVQIYVVIVISYLNVFPALDFLFSSGQGLESFVWFQLLVICFFEIPLLFMLDRWDQPIQVDVPPVSPKPRMSLSPWLPVIFGMMLAVFWYVSIAFNFFFLRGISVTFEVPSSLLYLYRATLETSFFVIVFLSYALRSSTKGTRQRGLYKLMLIAYLISFSVYFVVNSRMYFLLLALCLVCTHPNLDVLSPRKIKVLLYGLLGAALVIGLTVLRELYLEQSGRLETEDLINLMRGVGWLISARLDSVAILNSLTETEFNPFGFHLSGILHVIDYNISYFIDPQHYMELKESMVTSPSVEIVNRLLSASEVDFPKSMIIDMFLSFGVLGLLATATLLGKVMCVVQRQTRRFGDFDLMFLTAIYALPMVLQFEKEFLGLIVSFLKWVPILAVTIYFRPRQYNTILHT